MIELIAFSSGEGWAFVRHDGELKLIRPPYRRWNLMRVDEATLERALQDQGFTRCEESHVSWADLINGLKARLVAERRARGRETPDPRNIRQLVHRAPPAVLRRFLDRVENELIPGRESQAAFEILTHLLAVDAVKRDPALYDRALALLPRCRQAPPETLDAPASWVDEAAAIAEQFPRAAARYGAQELVGFSHRVSERQQILAFGA